MTDATALQDLIDAIETEDSDTADTVSCDLFHSRGLCTEVMSAYGGSLDAAKAMHEALVPNWAVDRLTMWPGRDGSRSARLVETHEHKYGVRWHNYGDGRVEAAAATTARAWLLTILKAHLLELQAA